MPQAIMDDIAALDAESTEVLANIESCYERVVHENSRRNPTKHRDSQSAPIAKYGIRFWTVLGACPSNRL